MNEMETSRQKSDACVDTKMLNNSKIWRMIFRKMECYKRTLDWIPY